MKMLTISPLLFLISHLLFQPLPTNAGYIKSSCTSPNSYTKNSTFAANLATLLSSLVTQSSSSNSNTTTAGAIPDHAYGLYLCQGDLASSDCLNCINTATTDITNNCPFCRQAIIYYDNCQLRYSDQNFFGVPDTDGFNMTNPNFDAKTSSPEPLEAVTALVAVAPYRRPLMFASNASSDSIFALAQCSSDLTSKGCSECLTTILANIRNCCTGFNGWRYLAKSCWIRYESNPFPLLNLNGTYKEIIQNYCTDTDEIRINDHGVMNSNLKNLLSNLESKAQSTGFYDATVGEGSDQLFGLALCRGDLKTPGDNCSKCLSDARRTIAEDCTNRTQSIKWYEKCLMRYSNQSFFGVADLEGRILCGQDQLTQEAGSATISLASRLAGIATYKTSMVAGDEVAINSSLSSYVLVQCTRDLSSEECNKCLQTGLAKVTSNCKLINWWRYLSGSCTLRYETFAFFNTSASAISTTETREPVALAPKEGVFLGTAQRKNTSSKAKVVAIVAPILGAILLGPLLYYLCRRQKRRNDFRRAQFVDITPLSSTDLPLMDLAIIREATSNFSDANKLGEGGFGPVYKGILHGGKEIAVKRLSAKSKQGVAEFKNEVKLIAKLQHRNLVRMLGFCVEREEKMLIYEYLPNKSLDAFLFDPYKRSQLDWSSRIQIIAGIARGLLYLHEDSLLKVIHRDLKASNVLLDNKMNPKISDFGMAKIFGVDESEADTNRIVGTYGYMAPEYAMDGHFSVKSDVYSFGVLLLEILSGEKNGRSHFEKYGQTLLRHVWQLWGEDKAIELMDPLLRDSYETNEAVKCIHIGLLCVQENAEERPTMSLVVHMLRGDQTLLPRPTQPPTFIKQKASVSVEDSTIHSNSASSINDITITDVAPR